MSKELWGIISGFPDYLVCSHGRVKNRKGQILKFKPQRGGYHRVTLCSCGIRKDHQVHRLVAMGFISNPDNLPEVNHKDENGSNNFVENLEWCTHKYNISYGTCQARRMASRNYETVMCEVAQYDSSGNLIKIFRSQTMAALEMGVTSRRISDACNGKYNIVKGYAFKKHIREGSI